MGDKVGRIHLGRQDLGNLQTRKMKGLKRGRDVDAELVGDEEDDLTLVEGSGDEGETKRARKG